VGELIRRTLSEIFATGDLHEPGLSGLSITVGEVSVTPDLKRATAFVLPLGGAGGEAMLAALKRNKPEIRHQLARAMTLKAVPDLSFELDETFDRMDADAPAVRGRAGSGATSRPGTRRVIRRALGPGARPRGARRWRVTCEDGASRARPTRSARSPARGAAAAVPDDAGGEPFGSFRAVEAEHGPARLRHERRHVPRGPPPVGLFLRTARRSRPW
jgi:ribosome-binding factor A